jgi:hypothetical protein
MNKHHRRALQSASIPVAIGSTGLMKLGHFHLGVLAVLLVAAALLYRSMYKRSVNAEKYGVPPSTSIFLRGVDRRDLY